MTIEQSITIQASPEKVWVYLTEAEHVVHWLGCMRYQKNVGHVFYMQQDAGRRANDDISGATHCEILALDEPNLFSFSWFLPGTPATTVNIHLEPSGETTRVTLVHDGWDQFDAEAIRQIRDALAGGWKSFVLPGLKALVESKA